MDDDRLDEIERDLRHAERTLEQLEDGSYWAADGDGDEIPVNGSADAVDGADRDPDVTIELDPDVTAELQRRTR